MAQLLASRKQNKCKAKLKATLLQYFSKLQNAFITDLELIYNTLYYKAESISGQMFSFHVWPKKQLPSNSSNTQYL